MHYHWNWKIFWDMTPEGTGTYLHTLPPPESTPLFAQHDSLYQLIAKCCAADPADGGARYVLFAGVGVGDAGGNAEQRHGRKA